MPLCSELQEITLTLMQYIRSDLGSAGSDRVHAKALIMEQMVASKRLSSLFLFLCLVVCLFLDKRLYFLHFLPCLFAIFFPYLLPFTFFPAFPLCFSIFLFCFHLSFFPSTGASMCWNTRVQTCIYHGSCCALSRCFEVLPARAPWTINDLWTLQWLDPSLKVCIISDQCCHLHVKGISSTYCCFTTNLSCRPAAFKIKTSACRLCSMPVRNSLQPTTPTLSESAFPCFTPLLVLSFFIYWPNNLVNQLKHPSQSHFGFFNCISKESGLLSALPPYITAYKTGWLCL